MSSRPPESRPRPFSLRSEWKISNSKAQFRIGYLRSLKLAGHIPIVFGRVIRPRISRQVDAFEYFVRSLGLFGEIVGRQGLGGVEDQLGLHRPLLQTVVAIGGGIQMRSDDIRDDHQIAVRLKT